MSGTSPEVVPPLASGAWDAGGDVSLFRDVRSYSFFAGLTVVLANLYAGK